MLLINKTQQMCGKGVQENSGRLESAPDCCENQQICDKVVNNFNHALKFVPNWYKTQNCVIKQLILILLQYNLLLNAMRFYMNAECYIMNAIISDK